MAAWFQGMHSRLYGSCCDGHQHVLFFVRGTEWVGQSKHSPFLFLVQCLLPQWYSQTWTVQGVTGSRISHQWLTPAAGALGTLSGPPNGHVPFLLQQTELHFLIKWCVIVHVIVKKKKKSAGAAFKINACQWHFCMLILKGSCRCCQSILVDSECFLTSLKYT